MAKLHRCCLSIMGIQMDIVSFIPDLLATDAIPLKLLLGALFGLCLGLTGVGGGVLLIPMLQVFCGMPAVLAVGTASIIAAGVKVNASLLHVKDKNVSWNAVVSLLVGSVPVTLLVTQLVVFFSDHADYGEITQEVIRSMIIIVMLGSLATVFSKYRKQKQKQIQRKPGPSKPVSKRVTVLSGMFCGSILGSTGVGGGVLLLPILNSVLQINIKKAIGTSVVLALGLSTIAALGYAKGGQTDIVTAVLFIVGSFAGVPVAARLIKSISDNTLYLLTIGVISMSLALTLFVS
jgi:uncharacterized membrane protein YfcA